jgi:hypothetical protein
VEWCGVEDTGEGLEVESCGVQVDSMDYIWTGGGLHKDPWGSVRYSLWALCPDDHLASELIIRGPQRLVPITKGLQFTDIDVQLKYFLFSVS